MDVVDFDNPAFDRDDIADDIWEVPDETPSWADSSVPSGISQEELADRWGRERGEAQENLEFASSTKGELWLRWGRKWLLLTNKNRPGKFLLLSTLKRYSVDVTKALGVYKSTGLPRRAVAALQAARVELGEAAAAVDTLPPGSENIPLREYSSVANDAIASTGRATTALEEELTPAQSAALETIDDPPLDVQWVDQAKRELGGLGLTMIRKRYEVVNNLTELDRHIAKKKDHIAREHTKMSETNDEGLQQEIQSRITALERELSDLQLEREARLEAASIIKEDLRGQINRVRETIDRMTTKPLPSAYALSSASKG